MAAKSKRSANRISHPSHPLSIDFSLNKVSSQEKNDMTSRVIGKKNFIWFKNIYLNLLIYS